MAGLVMYTRAGVGVLIAALGVGLVAPAAASASPSPLSRTAAFSAPSVARATTTLPILRVGSRGARVTFVQRTLGVKTTGYYGPLTRAAVVKFQKKVHFHVITGSVGPKTWAALKRYAAARAAARAAAAPAPPVSSGDPTMTAAAKATKPARQAVLFAIWLASPHGKAVAKRESGGRCTAVSSGGTYRGKWQMNAGFWKSYGGLAFAAKPDLATCAEQDKVAYRGWIASWWHPWGG